MYCKRQVDGGGRIESEGCKRVAAFRVGVESEGPPTKMWTNVSVQQERANRDMRKKFRGVIRRHEADTGGWRSRCERLRTQVVFDGSVLCQQGANVRMSQQNENGQRSEGGFPEQETLANE